MTRASSIASALALAAALALAGCAGDSGGPRVRVYDGGSDGPGEGATGGAPTRDPNAVPVEVSPGGSHIVRRGQTLYAIARAYGAPLRALITENDLEPPYRLEVGQRLKVPRARVHTVERGDTVYGISRSYGVSMDELVRRNDIEPPYTIEVGEKLLIPGQVTGGETATTTAEAAAGAADGGAAPDTGRDSAASDERAGEADAATADGRDADSPPDGADIAARVRQALDSPDARGAPDGGGAGESAASTTDGAAEADLPERPFRVTEAGHPRPRMKPEPPRQLASIADPPARAGSRFLWPVRGRVVSGFGAKSEGLHNDGLNIAAPRGSPVRAAENGVVAYAGAELEGFGNSVLIKHADGYMTFYAHNGELLVERGQRIQRGQTIARIGSSGNVESPQLHFQIRKRRQALDPSGLLAS